MGSRFLFNEALWNELAERVPKAKSARVAVAYLGGGAARLLPLKKGDRLVVDLSLRAVRSGTTNPYEVRKYLRRGVQVFSRDSLHAKFFLLGKVVITGSANISKHSKNALDEAATMTDDAAVLRRATEVFEQLCTEPVRSEYLNKCLKEYRRPSFGGGGGERRPRRRNTAQGKVWIVSGLVYRDLPERERDLAERTATKAVQRLSDFERFEVDRLPYAYKPRYLRRLQEGDWLVVCIRDGAGFDVEPPCRYLGVESYPRGKGKRRYLVLYESSLDAEIIRWSTFRKLLSSRVPNARTKEPRTGPVVEEAAADAVLRLWDARARFRPGKKR